MKNKEVYIPSAFFIPCSLFDIPTPCSLFDILFYLGYFQHIRW
jgi:hypothetical protein